MCWLKAKLGSGGGGGGRDGDEGVVEEVEEEVEELGGVVLLAVVEVRVVLAEGVVEGSRDQR